MESIDGLRKERNGLDEGLAVWTTENQGKVLPPMRAPIRISLWVGMESSIFHTRVIGREPWQDFLDAIKTKEGQVISDPSLAGLEASLWWGDDRRWFEYPVRIDEVLEPIPILAVRYISASVLHERRSGHRSNTRVPGIIQVLDRKMGGSAPCWTRDISEAACRMVVPMMVEPGERVRVQLALEPGRTWSAEGRVLRFEDRPTELYGLKGRHAVVCWDWASLGERETEWLLYCSRHRWDM